MMRSRILGHGVGEEPICRVASKPLKERGAGPMDDDKKGAGSIPETPDAAKRGMIHRQ